MKEKSATWNNWRAYLHVCKSQIDLKGRRLLRKLNHHSSMYEQHQEAQALISLLLKEVAHTGCATPSVLHTLFWLAEEVLLWYKYLHILEACLSPIQKENTTVPPILQVICNTRNCQSKLMPFLLCRTISHAVSHQNCWIKANAWKHSLTRGQKERGKKITTYRQYEILKDPNKANPPQNQ